MWCIWLLTRTRIRIAMVISMIPRKQSKSLCRQIIFCAQSMPEKAESLEQKHLGAIDTSSDLNLKFCTLLTTYNNFLIAFANWEQPLLSSALTPRQQALELLFSISFRALAVGHE